MVTIVICYRPGTAEILKVCLSSLERHTNQEVVCIVATTKTDDGLMDLQMGHQFTIIETDVSSEPLFRIHGNMLDKVIPSDIQTEYLLTLDSDCFPVADGWLQDLLDMMGESRVVGILHPWAPPPDDMLRMKMAWRIRSQHCWNRTHVACQMIRTNDYKELQGVGVSYSGGDDTGLLIPMRAQERGWGITGFLPTRCPLPSAPDDVSSVPDRTIPFDPEFNRNCCVVYGDKVCHIGSYTLSKYGNGKPDSEPFEWAVERILAESGAEFLLQDRLSYRYQFDREEEVAEYKMNLIFGVSSDGRSLRQS